MHLDVERIGFPLIITGLALLVLGYLWLLVRGFRTDKRWGFALLIPPWFPQAGAFALRHRKPARGPILMLFVGLLLFSTPFILNFANRYLLDLGPLENRVNGELHLTLTGWDRKDYDTVLGARPDVVVLQMANADVNDETLKCLEGLDKLRELDLNETQISDKSLPLIARLPQLESLRLRRTRITDQGFQTYIVPIETLRELDLRGTQVKSATVRTWTKGREDRKALR